MKLKYYTESILKIFLILSVILILFTQISSAAILTSTVSEDNIFKCQGSLISATFDDAGIISVNALVSSKVAVNPMLPGSGRTLPETETTVVPMVLAGGIWTGTFGNNSNLLWGTRTITYQVDTGVINNYLSGSEIFVASDRCTGIGKTNYTQIITPLGNYTRLLITHPEMNLLDLAIYVWVQWWGYMFYVLLIFMVCTSVWFKSESIIYPIVAAFVMLMGLSTSGYIPLEYRNYFLLAMGTCIGIVYYLVFVRED